MTRWCITVEYDGSGFVGWQRQPTGRSVQATLEDALHKLLGERPHVAGSGRTDAGVHAEGQVAAFTTGVTRSARSIRDGLNAHLPQDVACVAAVAVDDGFDPRRDQKRKTYRYTWMDRPSRSPLRGGRVWHLGKARLDDARMHAAVQALVGTHRFDSFRAAGCAAKHTLRTLEGAAVRRRGDLVSLDLVGTGFLRHMVRIVAGTLTDVGTGREGVDHLAHVLAARDRAAAGRTAPPQGLTLVSVVYDAPWSGPGQGDEDGAAGTYSSSSS